MSGLRVSLNKHSFKIYNWDLKILKKVFRIHDCETKLSGLLKLKKESSQQKKVKDYGSKVFKICLNLKKIRKHPLN